MKTLGTAACPPYHIAFVIGGTSAEKNLLTVKLASTRFYDNLPTTGNEYGRAFRDVELEKQVLEEAHRIGLGAQFGGKYYAHDVRIIRLPRHGASCPVGLGVSCSADRNIRCKINKDGVSCSQSVKVSRRRMVYDAYWLYIVPDDVCVGSCHKDTPPLHQRQTAGRLLSNHLRHQSRWEHP